MAVDDDLSQSEKKMAATEANVASSSHSPEKTRTASAPAGENKADTAEEAKETPGKLEPSAAEGEDVVSIKKKTRSSAPAGDLLPESMADDELCQSEKKVTTTPLGEGNVVSSHCSSAKTSTGSAPAGDFLPESMADDELCQSENKVTTTPLGERNVVSSHCSPAKTGTSSAPAGETKPETVQEGKGAPRESNLGVAEGDKMISKKVTRTSSTGSAPAGETEPETVKEVTETTEEGNQGVGEGEEVISTKKVTKTSTVSAPAGETEPETVQEATQTPRESKPVIDGEAEAQNVNESKETPEFVSGGGAHEGADYEFIERCEESKTETSSSIGADQKEDLGKSAEDLGYDMGRDTDKKEELSHVYLLLKLPNEDKKGMLVYRYVDEQADGVRFVTTPCEISRRSKKCNALATYVYQKQEWGKSEEATQQGPSLSSHILRAAKSAKKKQEEIEKSYPNAVKYGKCIFKTAVPFPFNVAVDLPTMYDAVDDLRKIIKLPEEQRYKKLGVRAINAALWAGSSLVGQYCKIGVPFVWDKEVYREMTKTVWDEEISKRSEESEAKVEREEEVEEEDDGTIWVYVTEDGFTVVYVFSVCDENEEAKNDEDFSEYFSGFAEEDSSED